MRQITSDSVDLKELANQGFVFPRDAVHATPIVGSEGADATIQDTRDLADVIAEADIGTRAKKWESISFKPRQPFTQERITLTILKFYEKRLPSGGATGDWISLGEKAEKRLADMYDRYIRITR
jgi:hypothetical protein